MGKVGVKGTANTPTIITHISSQRSRRTRREWDATENLPKGANSISVEFERGDTMLCYIG